MARADSNNTPDPIYAAIEAHRAAETALEKAHDDYPDDDDESKREQASDEANREMKNLCTTEPATLAGLAALMAYLRPLYEQDELGHIGYPDGKDPLFQTLAASTAKLAGSAHS